MEVGYGKDDLLEGKLLDFNGDTIAVAEALAGSFLITPQGVFCVWETEAYRGSDDEASHAFRGQTPRNRAMFMGPGTIYVYLCYGVHHCLNLVTEEEGVPGAVLIRAVKPCEPGKTLIDGPGLTCRALGVDRSFDGSHLNEVGWRVMQPSDRMSVKAHRRIGIRKAVELPWRFRVSASEIR